MKVNDNMIPIQFSVFTIFYSGVLILNDPSFRKKRKVCKKQKKMGSNQKMNTSP